MEHDESDLLHSALFAKSIEKIDCKTKNDYADSKNEKGVESAKAIFETVTIKPKELHYLDKKIVLTNLPWWTTDQDIENAVKQLGVNDIIKVTFQENKMNGVSLGIASIEVTLDKSFETIVAKFSDVEFYGFRPKIAVQTKSTGIETKIQPLDSSNSVELTHNVTAPISVDNAKAINKPITLDEVDTHNTNKNDPHAFFEENPFYSLLKSNSARIKKDTYTSKEKADSGKRAKKTKNENENLREKDKSRKPKDKEDEESSLGKKLRDSDYYEKKISQNENKHRHKHKHMKDSPVRRSERKRKKEKSHKHKK